MSDGVVFLPSFYEAIKDFPDDERLQMYEAIILYGLYQETIEFNNPVLRSLFALVKPVIDSSQNRHRAAKENGKKGGAPKGNQNARKSKENNQRNNQTNNQTNNQDIDIDIDIDLDTDLESRKAAKPPRAPVLKYGCYGWVKLTEEQHKKLQEDLGSEELERCISYIDESVQETGNKNKWKDWNLVIRKCSRNQWGVKPGQKEKEDDWRKDAVKAWNGNS